MRTVRKGWMRWERGATPQRVIVDDLGFSLGKGLLGWMLPPEGAVIHLLPKALAFEWWPNQWWWTPRLWRRPEWAWIYGAP